MFTINLVEQVYMYILRPTNYTLNNTCKLFKNLPQTVNPITKTKVDINDDLDLWNMIENIVHPLTNKTEVNVRSKLSFLTPFITHLFQSH